jgi:tryptophan synthase beta chain
MERAPALPKDAVMIVNLSGRGDKDVAQVAPKVGLQLPA